MLGGNGAPVPVVWYEDAVVVAPTATLVPAIGAGTTLIDAVWMPALPWSSYTYTSTFHTPTRSGAVAVIVPSRVENVAPCCAVLPLMYLLQYHAVTQWRADRTRRPDMMVNVPPAGTEVGSLIAMLEITGA